MGLFEVFKAKNWEPKRVEAPVDLNYKVLHTNATYPTDEGITGNDMAIKFAGEDFAWVDFRVVLAGKSPTGHLNGRVFIVDTKGKFHFISYLGDYGVDRYREIMKNPPERMVLRLNRIGNVDIAYY